MIGSFLTRGLVMVFGYAYPAYECFKTVEKNKPEIEQLRFWCQYWILVAVLTVFERVGDTFVSWLPMYSEAKLAFFVYLWYPKTRGTTYVYDAFLKPYVAKHETEIDRNLLELRARAGDMAVLYWQRAASYGQTRIFEILQFVAAQSASRPGPAQQQAQQQARVRIPPPAPPSTRMATQGPQEQPPPPQAATTEESVQEVSPPPVPPKTLGSNSVPKPSGEPSAIQRSASGPSQAPKTVSTQSQVQKTAAASSQVQKTTSQGSTTNTQKAASREPETTSQGAAPSSEDTTTQVNMQLTVGEVNSNPPAQETVMEESIRVTRGRLRKNRGTANR